MSYFLLEPEVPATMGGRTVLDSTVHPPVVTWLSLELCDQTNASIIECFPCFAITEKLAHYLQVSRLTGYSLGEMEMTLSDDLVEEGLESAPPFRRLIIEGKQGADDFSLAEDGRLVVSSAALSLIKECGEGGLLVEPC